MSEQVYHQLEQPTHQDVAIRTNMDDAQTMYEALKALNEEFGNRNEKLEGFPDADSLLNQLDQDKIDISKQVEGDSPLPAPGSGSEGKVDGIPELDSEIQNKLAVPEDVVEEVKFCFGVSDDSGKTAAHDGSQNPGPQKNDNINGYLH